eukprot:1637431-Karenia_brevis.AAC.1
MTDFNSQDIANTSLKMAKRSGTKDFTSQELANTATQKAALNDFNSQEIAGFELQKHQYADHASSVTLDASHARSKDFNSHLQEFNPQDLANT